MAEWAKRGMSAHSRNDMLLFVERPKCLLFWKSLGMQEQWLGSFLSITAFYIA
jgi:hypothetical protein